MYAGIAKINGAAGCFNSAANPNIEALQPNFSLIRKHKDATRKTT
jgi:hypothetical protein